MNITGMILHILIVGIFVFLIIRLKNKINCKILLITFAITFLLTMVLPCFESMQKFTADKAKLTLGFPFDFYTIKYTAMSTFAIHFNIAGFIANIVIVYLAVTICVRFWERVKGIQK